MKIELQSLRSRLSRRIFGFFILSAFVPILTISLVSYYQISAQLEKEAKRQVYRESRAIGLTIYDRFLALETNLKLITNALESSNNRVSISDSEWLQSIFDTIFIIDENGDVFPLFGEATGLEEISSGQEEHLRNEKTLVQIQSTDEEQPGIFLIRSFLGGDGEKKYLAGKINGTYIWDLGIHEPDMFCVLDHLDVVIHCSEALKYTKRKKLFTGFRESSVGGFNYWNINDIDYAVNMWSVFLEARYQENVISVMMARPRETVFASLDKYKSIVPRTLLITGLLVALLSLIQIRRSLVPLEKLAEGTNRVARGDFNSPVEIISGDEFEKLGDSFNLMANRINEQFQTITALAVIDRLILSTLDRSYIIETLIRHLHNIVNAAHVCVVTLEDRTDGRSIIRANEADNVNQISEQEIIIGRDEYLQLEGCDDYLLLSDDQPKSYTQDLIDAGDKSFLIFPVRTKEGLVAFIGVCTFEKKEYTDNTLLQLREMADRVAVALSNAAWEEQLYHQAHYDALTQLPNRSYFKVRLEQEMEMAKRNEGSVAILFIDLDRFKGINDSLGHAFGDQVLIHVAGVLNECVRKSETVARFGGDEFIVIVSESNDIDKVTNEAIKLASRILNQISKPFTLNRREVYVTPSIGVALYPKDADNYHDLLKNADSAMYTAKEQGRACYRFYSKEQNENALQLLDLANDLRHALERNELGLIYQPKISCKTGKVTGAEALIRWEHPRHGTVQPDEFISIAEESGLIAEIGLWVLKTACRQNKLWLDKGDFKISMAVNLSAEQFRQTDLFENIKQVIRETGLPANYLELEITESLTIENFKKTIDVLKKLQDLGLTVAIDDFGTGYSSLSYLQQFPINELKIDRSFINGIPHNDDSRSIVKAMVALAHSLDLSVTSEGVESGDQFEFLCGIGCDEVQGYYISQALTAEDFEKFAVKQ